MESFKKLKPSIIYLLVCTAAWLCAQFSPFDVGANHLQFDRNQIFIHDYYIFLAIIGLIFQPYAKNKPQQSSIRGAFLGILSGTLSYLIVVADNFWSLGSDIAKVWAELPISILYVNAIFLTPLWGALIALITSVFLLLRKRKSEQQMKAPIA